VCACVHVRNSVHLLKNQLEKLAIDHPTS
jgi:hypothetical protein